jgi:N-acyl-D-aspartate/D-glutamate deacylase
MKRRLFFTFLTAFALCCIQVAGHSSTNSILIKGGLVYDGSLNKPVKCDVLIIGDRIAFVGDCTGKTADRVIDASGYIVTPGFIDPHSHSDGDFLKERKSNENYLQMGVTTVLCGQCGSGSWPMTETFEKMRSQSMGTNCGLFLGHSPLRRAVLGEDQMRDATKEEIEKMKQLAIEAMNLGAFGISTGLYYLPGTFTSTEELIEVISAISDYGGIYATHIRSEGTSGVGLDSAINEAIRIAREAQVQLNISHIKSSGGTKGSSGRIIAAIETAQNEGLYITADQYPYLASSTALSSALLPKWAQVGGRKAYLRRFDHPGTLDMIKEGIKENISSRGGAGSIMIIKGPIKEYIGRYLNSIAKEMKLPIEDAVVEILRQGAPSIANFNLSEKNVCNYMKQPWVMTCTDGSFGGHPRATGSYPHKIQHYVLNKKILTMEQMIHKSTGKVAQTYGIEGRGFIKEGYYADLLVFKPKEFRANSTYANASAYASGLRLQLVNGAITIENSKYNGTLAGKPLKMKNSAKDPAIFESLMGQRMKKYGAIGLITAVVRDNEIVYHHSFGSKNLEGNPFRGDERDVVRIASISKSFCALSIMQLLEQDKIDLNADVGEILGFKVRNPKYPDDKITVSMLLSHTSSLNDSQGYKTLDRINPSKNPNYTKCYSNYAPGMGYKYCNLNFNMLGAVVEKISGIRYDRYVKQNILDPLGLTGSLNMADIPDTTICVPLYEYNESKGGFIHRPEAYNPLAKSDQDYILGYDPALFSTTGGMKMSALDLARYMMLHINYGALDGVRIVNESSARLMQSIQTPTDVSGIYYGYAMRTMQDVWIPGIVTHGHTGSAYGMKSSMTFDPIRKNGVITLCNGHKSKERPTESFDRLLFTFFFR